MCGRLPLPCPDLDESEPEPKLKPEPEPEPVPEAAALAGWSTANMKFLLEVDEILARRGYEHVYTPNHHLIKTARKQLRPT